MKRICILCLLAALLLGACGLADAPYMEPVRTYCAALQDGDFTRLQEAIPPAVLNADGFDAGELANVRDSFAKGSSNDYDITPKELDSRRIPESGCRVLEDYFRQQYDWIMTVDDTRPAKAAAYSAAPDYVERVGPALLEMRRQVQDRWDGDKMLSGMIVRHLILPGNTNSAIEVLDWLHSHLPGTYVSLMAQYTPMPGLERYPELMRTITRREYDKVVDHALALGMDHVFLQQRSAVGKDFIPAFDFTGIV